LAGEWAASGRALPSKCRRCGPRVSSCQSHRRLALRPPSTPSRPPSQTLWPRVAQSSLYTTQNTGSRKFGRRRSLTGKQGRRHNPERSAAGSSQTKRRPPRTAMRARLPPKQAGSLDGQKARRGLRGAVRMYTARRVGPAPTFPSPPGQLHGITKRRGNRNAREAATAASAKRQPGGSRQPAAPGAEQKQGGAASAGGPGRPGGHPPLGSPRRVAAVTV
jgi:hypothetical protein